jgi:hypothetical protein
LNDKIKKNNKINKNIILNNIIEKINQKIKKTQRKKKISAVAHAKGKHNIPRTCLFFFFLKMTDNMTVESMLA